MRLRLELCQLFGSGEGRASASVEVEPSDWRGSLKFALCRKDARVLGGP